MEGKRSRESRNRPLTNRFRLRSLVKLLVLHCTNSRDHLEGIEEWALIGWICLRCPTLDPEQPSRPCRRVLAVRVNPRGSTHPVLAVHCHGTGALPLSSEYSYLGKVDLTRDIHANCDDERGRLLKEGAALLLARRPAGLGDFQVLGVKMGACFFPRDGPSVVSACSGSLHIGTR